MLDVYEYLGNAPVVMYLSSELSFSTANDTNVYVEVLYLIYRKLHRNLYHETYIMKDETYLFLNILFKRF